MAEITPQDGYLTVLNLFDTDSAEGQERLLDAMRDIIDNADYPGWISSTLHSSQGTLGTANYIQWRSLADLQARYASDTFKHETMPVFKELATSIALVKAEVVFTQHRTGDPITVSPAGDDYTVIMLLGVEPENQDELVSLLAQPDEWIRSVPGYRSHSILRGIDGDAVVTYAQWDSAETYEAFHNLPEDQRPEQVQQLRARAHELVTYRRSNGHRVVHTRSAAAS